MLANCLHLFGTPVSGRQLVSLSQHITGETFHLWNCCRVIALFPDLGSCASNASFMTCRQGKSRRDATDRRAPPPGFILLPPGLGPAPPPLLTLAHSTPAGLIARPRHLSSQLHIELCSDQGGPPPGFSLPLSPGLNPVPPTVSGEEEDDEWAQGAQPTPPRSALRSYTSLHLLRVCVGKIQYNGIQCMYLISMMETHADESRQT